MGPRRGRQQRSLDTEARIVAAATERFTRDGYAATTMAALAAAAQVSVQSLYLRFGGKLEILSAALDAAIVGDTRPEPLLERPWFTALQAEPEGPAAVGLFVGEIGQLLRRSHPLYEVVVRAGDEARELLASNKAQRYEGVRAVARVLVEKPGFAGHLDVPAAADRLYAVVSEEQYGLLVAERRWSPEDWTDWTADLLARELFPGATAREGGHGDSLRPAVEPGHR